MELQNRIHDTETSQTVRVIVEDDKYQVYNMAVSTYLNDTKEGEGKATSTDLIALPIKGAISYIQHRLQQLGIAKAYVVPMRLGLVYVGVPADDVETVTQAFPGFEDLNDNDPLFIHHRDLKLYTYQLQHLDDNDPPLQQQEVMEREARELARKEKLQFCTLSAIAYITENGAESLPWYSNLSVELQTQRGGMNATITEKDLKEASLIYRKLSLGD
ncbi:hypothetical protein BGW36DRAFT_437611 [Talaromyces proteolyticus]|uniref:Uncharacterized protein n=1 Tax=Talaromyces proteolyticus TaxID=1131652 RepID=A0AAD4KGM3_9EURO|nr:uncharacterized protein BGW36DRAFT_437611 [Talaromyces proteolyticus]KAH8691923.1 hypothetical protein BGW36DRAFT_437611 [Talaromyces proteolyticus]